MICIFGYNIPKPKKLVVNNKIHLLHSVVLLSEMIFLKISLTKKAEILLIA